MEKPTQQYLKSILNYNPITGILTWTKSAPGIPFGAEAGCKTKNGYRVICVNRKLYYSHSLAYMIHSGEWPDLIDHKNRIKDDNRFENLIKSNKVKNGQNSNLSKRNKSGHKGVFFYKRDQKWQASIRHNNKSHHLGFFDEIQDAIDARKKAETEFGFNTFIEYK